MLTLEQIALAVKGEVVGDPSIEIISVDDINEAAKGSITFSFLPKYKTKISSSNASAFVTDSKDDLKGYNGACFKLKLPLKIDTWKVTTKLKTYH